MTTIESLQAENADLRRKLRELVAHWTERSEDDSGSDFDAGRALAYELCADQLSALLEETK